MAWPAEHVLRPGGVPVSLVAREFCRAFCFPLGGVLKAKSRYCRDCAHVKVIGLSLDEPVCRCARQSWGPEEWRVALVVPACDAFEPATEQPDSLDFWGLADGFGLGPSPRRAKKARVRNPQDDDPRWEGLHEQLAELCPSAGE